MERKIDKIIRKAKCIKVFLKNNKNIDNVIASLESYRDNIGELPDERIFYIGYCRHSTWRDNFNCDIMWYDNRINKEGYDRNIKGIKAIEFTTHIRKTVINDTHEVTFIALPPEIQGSHIADAVFDVQNFKITDVELMNILIDSGFKLTTQEPKFVGEFD